MAAARTGRRPGPNRTRAAILAAARASFAANGYEATTIRAVARDAGVDAALVHRFFGSKEQLFAAAMKLAVSPSELVERILVDGVDGVGERLVHALLTLLDAPGAFAPELRASLAGSQVVGLAMARYVVRVPPLADADPAEIAAAVGPTIQRYLTGSLRG